MLLLCQVQQVGIQYSMHRLLENKDAHFQRMVLDIETYKRSKVNSKEILLDGEMYDIKSLTFSDNNVELLVLHDKHEGSILKKIQLLLRTSSEQNSSIPNYLIQLIGLFYLSSFSEFIFNDFSYSNINYFSGEDFFKSHCSKINCPPPEA